MPETSSVTNRFQFIRRLLDTEKGARPQSATPPPRSTSAYWIVWYLPLTILKMWNFAPARSPFAVKRIGVPRIVFGRDTFAKFLRSSARVILLSLHDFVIALAYICAST